MTTVRFLVDLDVQVDPGCDDPDDPVFLAAVERKRTAIERALRFDLHEPALRVNVGLLPS